MTWDDFKICLWIIALWMMWPLGMVIADWITQKP